MISPVFLVHSLIAQHALMTNVTNVILLFSTMKSATLFLTFYIQMELDVLRRSFPIALTNNRDLQYEKDSTSVIDASQDMFGIEILTNALSAE